jgi:uncharacterized membrane protein YdbT with pleckstrin-like domain
VEYKQTPLALVAKSLTLWWWLGILTLGISIFWDVMSFKRTKLVLGDKSLTLYSGVLTQNSRDLPYKNIQTVNINQSVLGQVFGYGHIIVTTASATEPLLFKYVAKPQVLREVIQGKIQ